MFGKDKQGLIYITDTASLISLDTGRTDALRSQYVGRHNVCCFVVTSAQQLGGTPHLLRTCLEHLFLHLLVNLVALETVGVAFCDSQRQSHA